MTEIETPKLPETGDHDAPREPAPSEPRRLSRREFIPGAIGSLAAALGVGGVSGYKLHHPAAATAATEPTGPTATEIPTAGNPGSGVGSFVSRPDLHPALVRVTNRTGQSLIGQSPRFVVLAPMADVPYKTAQHGPMLVDREGRLIWYQPGSDSTFDVQVQSYRGKPVITRWHGRLDGGFGLGVGEIVDETYTTIAVVGDEQKRPLDLHEFTLTSRGTALATYYERRSFDLSAIGGAQNGYLLVGHALEIDVASGRTLLDWVSLDHVGLSESYQPHPGETNVAFDYFHINSVAEAADGNLLISGRNTWAVYKVGRTSGKVIWRLGGKRSDFQVDHDAGFSWQHHVRAHGGSAITVFDNADISGHGSLGLLLHVDEAARRVTLTQAYQHPAKFLSWSLGSVQLRPDGNVLVGWGSQPYFSEFSADGKLLLDGQLEGMARSYRTFLAEWTGRPANKPAMVARSAPGSGFVIYASWNGATEIDHWTVLAGKSASSLQPVGSQPWSGFETVIVVGSQGPQFAVAAIDRDGNELGRSEVV
jgi:hypothetical protein